MDDEQKKIELQKQYDAYRKLVARQRSLQQDGERIVDELQSQGVTLETKMDGLGDLVHATLKTLGITEERFKKILGVDECNCNKRRAFLNKLLPFKNQRVT